MSIGDRMKMYERQEAGRKFLPLLPVYARIDGRSFSSFTRQMNRPYDVNMATLMIETTKYLVGETNAVMGYTQSDEISLAWYSNYINTQVFFDGRIFKITSVIAAMATAYFNRRLPDFFPSKASEMPVFDCRAFQLPSLTEAANAFLWREMDATKNAISMAAHHYFSHKSLQGKTGGEMQEMLWQQNGINFNDYPTFFKRGSFVQRRKILRELSEAELMAIPERFRPTEPVERSDILVIDIPKFSSVTNRVDVIFSGADPINLEGSK